MNTRGGGARRAPLQPEAQSALHLWAALVLEMNGVLGSGQKRPDVFLVRERGKQPASGRHLVACTAARAFKKSLFLAGSSAASPHPPLRHRERDSQSRGREMGSRRRSPFSQP